jgi:membrane protease YdiL (CAAX protease family)
MMAPVQDTSGRYTQAAGAMHTIIVLVILGVWAFLGKIIADQMRGEASPHRVRFYLLTILFEWLLVFFLVAGVRRSGAPLALILGVRWSSARQLLKDIGIAAAYWLVSSGLLVILARLLRVGPTAPRMDFILPHGAAEITLWVALSVTAGICEEAIFRGYLQQQFIALTTNAPAGILLSAAVFGAAHAYQGFRMVILIGLYGAMFSILAYWRGTVRPGMIAHAFQDTVSGVVSALMRH